MKIKSNNPPAFPALHLDGHRGMSLRDYYAAAALMSMLSSPEKIDSRTPELAAVWCYKFADAMLKQREL